jgi:hypothetical protein
MSRVMSEHLRCREAKLFARYLFGTECPDEVAEAYSRFHQLYPSRIESIDDWFDRLLTRMGRRRLLLPIADSYAALFRPRATLRKRLVLCLSLLECVPECDQKLRCTVPVARTSVTFEVMALLTAQFFLVLAMMPLLAPLDFFARLWRSLLHGRVARLHV